MNSTDRPCRRSRSSSRLQVSQYEKNVDIFYSLRVYSTCEFALNPVPEYYNARYQQEITGEWKGKTAGGCQNNQTTYKNNPLFQPQVSDWRSMVDSVMIDSAYDGKVFNIKLADVPERKNDLVEGKYVVEAKRVRRSRSR